MDNVSSAEIKRRIDAMDARRGIIKLPSDEVVARLPRELGMILGGVATKPRGTRSSIDYYEAQRRDFGQEFLDEYVQGTHKIVESAVTLAGRSCKCRRPSLSTGPFSVHPGLRVQQNECTIVAVAHAKRKPDIGRSVESVSTPRGGVQVRSRTHDAADADLPDPRSHRRCGDMVDHPAAVCAGAGLGLVD